ncbi:MAG: glycine--tRNA ligase [Nanoarchaeota archaeon]
MAYIIKKKINGGEYYYMRESVREGEKVKSKNVAYLGKNKEEAKRKFENMVNKKTKIEDKDIIKYEQNELSNEVKNSSAISVEEMAAFCKRKGFVYPSGEIYGGLSGFWDFGVLGAEMKKNLKNEWWKYHVYQRDDIVGIDGAIITNPKVWEASGHVASFVDVAVLNKKTKEKFKVDKHEVKKYENNPNYEIKGEFNPMFTTQVGPVVEDSVKSYLRPETAQLIFADFKLVFDNARLKLPCGIAQQGKAFRNEIAPRDFLFRCREFEQMEIEYFVNPEDECPYKIPDVEIMIYSSEMQKTEEGAKKMKLKEALETHVIKNKWHAYWIANEYLWFISLGANKDKFRIRQHVSEEKAHYSQDTWDLEYEFPFGWKELLGFADRGNFDLSQHEKFSGKDLHVLDEKTGKKIIPQVVCEPSLGFERAFLVFMFDAYFYDEKRQNVTLRLNPKLAPVKAAIFPIIKKDEYENICHEILVDLRKEWNVIYDKSGSIGRRYARNDEAGTPYCITIDEDSVKQVDVTIRERDTAKQIRVKIKDLKNVLRQLINGEKEFENSGKLV